MSEKDLKNTKNTLVDFMKKQAELKIGGQNSGKRSAESQLKKIREDKQEEEKEALNEAKKESKAKAANINNSRMIMKLIVESSTKYVLMILILIGAVFLLVEAVPMIFKFFHGFLSKMLLGNVK